MREQKQTNSVLLFACLHFLVSMPLAFFFVIAKMSCEGNTVCLESAAKPLWLYSITEALSHPALDIQRLVGWHIAEPNGMWLVPLYLANSVLWGFGLMQLRETLMLCRRFRYPNRKK